MERTVHPGKNKGKLILAGSNRSDSVKYIDLESKCCL